MAQQNRIAVRRGMGHGVDRDVATGATLVLDHDLLAPNLGEPLGDDAGRRVGAATSRKSYHKPHGTIRPGLRLRDARERWQRSSARGQMQKFPTIGKFHRWALPFLRHSITSSARARSIAGTSRPSALAVLRLMTSSYLVGACTGRSAGFSPLRMRSTYSAARRNWLIRSGP